jgi:hypothetical protein
MLSGRIVMYRLTVAIYDADSGEQVDTLKFTVNVEITQDYIDALEASHSCTWTNTVAAVECIEEI